MARYQYGNKIHHVRDFEKVRTVTVGAKGEVQEPGVRLLKTMKKPRIYTTSFASVYPFYIQKAEKKGRTKAEVDIIICWLTGYNQQVLQQQIDKNIDFETFFDKAPQLNQNATKITGVICGYRVEEIEDKLMQKIRYLDKLIDELAKGKSMEKILRR
jgi:hypothetical protein